MQKLVLASLFIITLFGCKPESEPSCYEPSSFDEAFIAWDGVNIGDSIAVFIAKYPDTFDFSPYVNGYSVKSIVLLDGLRWVAEAFTRNQGQKAIITGISLSPISGSHPKDSTLLYRETALRIMKAKGRPKYCANPRAAASSGQIKNVNDAVTKNCAFLRVCDGASFLLYSYSYYDSEDATRGPVIYYRTTFDIYDHLHHTPFIVGQWPDYFPFNNE